MSCSNRGGSYGGNYGGNDMCVKDVIKKILDAQRSVSDDGYTCDTSCERSIDDLLSPDRHHRPRHYTTIPFMLFTKDCVKPFVGSGFTSRRGRRGHRRGNFRCVESPIFKVKGFKKGSNSCVTLELLEPIKSKGDHHHDAPRLEGETDTDLQHHSSGCGCSMCKSFGDHYFDNFCYTGICITVDLDCFCGISCLDPVRPESMYD